ncbi:MAG: membrane protein insertion efficiency factor YidD [Bacteroidales bacterium]|nr:membrane protein insertion efficiency factor YidD [Bacteroidales bacterium]
MRRYGTWPFIGLIYVYRYIISPLLPRGCRHYPSCSEYAITALKQHGLLKGGLLAANRISRCQPWGTSGIDPVPRIIAGKIKYSRFRQRQKMKIFPTCNRLKRP